MNDFTTYIAVNWHGLAIAALLGAAIAIVLITPLPSRLEKPPTTQPVASSRKSGRARVRQGGAR